MAMLAEPRRKQKFGCDPRNTYWSNDDSKFGQRMLERMGWSKGKGLGASESGRTEHITAVFRQSDDTRGVGCSKKHADNWLAHQDDFNSLLESLNQGKDDSNADSTPADDASAVASLVEKSKSSRSRVHYHKFTRGKDLSSRSAHDLDCIFGKRKGQTSESNTPVSQSEANSDEEASQETPTPGLGSTTPTDRSDNTTSDALNHGIKTVTSSSSVQEYFARKMAELRSRQNGASNSPRGSDQESAATNATASPAHVDGEDTEVQQQKKKKKKKKKSEKESNEREQQDSEYQPAVDEVVENNTGQTNSEGDSTRKRKKKKKDKHESATEEMEDTAGETCSVIDNSDISQTDDKSIKKKKKKKFNLESETVDPTDEAALISVSASVPDSVMESTCDEPTKKKKKKRKTKEITDEDCSGTTEMNISVSNPTKKSVRFSLGGDDLYLPGVEESVKSDVSLSQSRIEESGNIQISKKRTRDSLNDDVADEPATKKKNLDAEPVNQDSDATTEKGVSGNTPKLVNDEHSNVDKRKPVSTHRKKNKKKKKKGKHPVDVFGKRFHGSNLSAVKGYGI